MGPYALIFPGQGSQAVGMGRELQQAFPEAALTFAEADEALGFSLSSLCFEGSEDELRRTENAQPAILTVSIAAYRALAARTSLAPAALAGHSFGEYSALVASGVLSFVSAVRLVRKRGELMASASPPGRGTMAALLGLDGEKLASVLAAAGAVGVVEPATLNAPGQVVVAGETAAVAEASRLAAEAGAAKVIPLQVSGPFHSSLMRRAADEFAAVLAEAEMSPARAPVYANVTAQPTTEPGAIKNLLVEQIYRPVRWEETIRAMIGAGVGTFVEIGPGRVLSGLVRRIDRAARVINVGDEAGLKEALAILGEV